jgi:hypothetical protein
MSEQNFYKEQKNNKIKDAQGGEKKVMKKSLSILLILSLVLTMFSGVAFAADSASGTELKGYGVIKGDASGDLMEAAKWKRQDVVVILTRLLGVSDVVAQAYPNTHGFTDVTDAYYHGFISWAKDQGLFQGRSATEFGFGDDITYQEFAAAVIRALGYTGASAITYDAVPAKAVEIGLAPAGTNMQLAAARSAYFEVLVSTLNAKKTDGNVLGTALKIANFTLKPIVVNTIVATTAEVNTIAGQSLSFSINGESVATSASALTAAGYTVVFKGSNLNFIDNTATGALEDLTTESGSFDYSVAVTKAGVTKESAVKTVKITNYATTAVKVVSAELYVESNVKVTTANLAISDASILTDNVKIQYKDGKETTYAKADFATGGIKFATSNAQRAVIDPAGNISLVTPGTVTFKVSAGSATVLDVPVTIGADARTVAKVTTDVSSVKYIVGSTINIKGTATDQYGNLLKGYVIPNADVVKTGTTDVIARITGATSDKDGKFTLTLDADAVKVGKGNYQIKSGSTVLATVTVDVGAVGTTASRKLELASASSSTTLDLIKGSTTTTVGMVYNKYNADGYLQLLSDEIGVGSTYTVESSDTAVATVSEATGVITVTAVGKGTANVLIKEGSITRASVAVTVVNTTPTITAVTFEKDLSMKTTADLALTSVLKTANIVISGKQTVLVDNDGVIYVDIDTVSGYGVADIKLGQIGVVSYVRNSGGASVGASITGGEIDGFAAGNVGQVVVTVKKQGDAYATAVTTIEVAVPAAI